MKTLLLGFAFLIALTGFVWSRYHNKSHLQFSFPLRANKALFIEQYSAGLANNLTAEYLTDSTHFRKYLGTLDDESEIISVVVQGDQIVVDRNSNYRNSEMHEPSKIRETVYSLRALQEAHEFE
ncbi:hypothetical protein GCM10028824_26530 [Hymenobacter segetis]|uniref:DUF4230 domain-containing protein n=1 Tax=Hymenobacter segetis TaxID=2025509 RepID=A0ABU9LYJ2_9BACT